MNVSLLALSLLPLAFISACASHPLADTPSTTCDCACAPPAPDPEELALPPLVDRKIESLRRLKERAPIKKGPHVEELTPRVQETHRVFFGNLHSHTSYSDGSALPEQAYVHARDQGHLDFLALTEHNHSEAGGSSGNRIADDHARYEGPRTDGLIPTATRLTVDGSFIALYGQEFSSIGKGNHANVFDVPHVIDEHDVENGEFGKLLNNWLPANLDSTGGQAILQLNHPWNSSSPNDQEYGRDDISGFAAWRTKLDARARLIEVINGPSHETGTGKTPSISDTEYRRYLNMGFHLAPAANQDNHFETWGTITDARTAVITTTLSKASILAALRDRHAYATLDRNLRIIASVQGHLCGSIITDNIANGAPLDIEISIDDDDEPTGRYWIEVFADKIDGETGDTRAKLVATFGPADATSSGSDPNIWALDGLTYDGWDYLYMRVLQGSQSAPDKQAWLAPVWFE